MFIYRLPVFFHEKMGCFLFNFFLSDKKVAYTLATAVNPPLLSGVNKVNL